MSIWRATVVKDPPESGSAKEHHFDMPSPESSNWCWVRFESEEGAEWFGCFREGCAHQRIKTASGDGLHFYILAGGCGYCIDAETSRLLGVLDTSLLTDVLAIPGTRDAAFADFSSVEIVSPEGIKWETPRIAWDGIRLLSASPTEVSGFAETSHGPGGDRLFRLDLVNKTVEGGYANDFVPRSTTPPAQRNEDLERVIDRVLDKNDELYRRLS